MMPSVVNAKSILNLQKAIVYSMCFFHFTSSYRHKEYVTKTKNINGRCAAIQYPYSLTKSE